jgi:hypothetical protein
MINGVVFRDSIYT